MTRIIVHAGFHKTGTTSLQGFLELNRTALLPHAAIYLKTQLGPLRFLGRWYGQRPSLRRRLLFRAGLRRFLRKIPDAPVILISRESFSGMMPGFRRRGRLVTGYGGTAVPLALDIVAALRKHFGPEAQIEFLYTVRDGAAVVDSLWAHVLRVSRLTDDLPAYRARFGPPPDLRAEAERVAEAVASVPVRIAALEDMAHDPLGPGGAVLDLLGIPANARDGFRPAPHGNPGASPDLCARFLELNRGGMRGRELRAAKRALWLAERAEAA